MTEPIAESGRPNRMVWVAIGLVVAVVLIVAVVRERNADAAKDRQRQADICELVESTGRTSPDC